MAERIISLFPSHHSYLEPFFGSGAVLFNKPRSNIETINDLDDNVVNLFECIRRDPERLGHLLYVQGRERAYAARNWTELPEGIFQAAERLRGVQIECRPALEVIRRFNYQNVLIYADPPYVLSSRSGGKKQYRYEMTDGGHVALLNALKDHRGPVVISGYASPMYDRLLCDWHRETMTTTDQLSRRRQEILWMNFDPTEQMSVF